MEINSAHITFFGVFKYERIHFYKKNDKNIYSESTYFKENQSYFSQKYYPNWLQSLFIENGQPLLSNINSNISHNHLLLNLSSIDLADKLSIKVHSLKKELEYDLNSVEVFLFKENLGVFIIKTSLQNPHRNVDDIISFAHSFRGTTINSQNINSQNTVDFVEKYIISYFNANKNSWRKYNPQLKTAFFVDIASRTSNDKMNRLLYNLGTFTTSKLNDGIFAPDEEYYEELLNNNTISVFQNWKVLCLHDSLIRVAVNLDKYDKYKLWENEYILIYLYVLQAQYYLYHVNTKLAEEQSSLSESKNLRDNFISFMNSFEHRKISYKYLPNVLFDKFKLVLDIQGEINLIENKISRINKELQEKTERSINNILLFLTLITVVSVAHDAGQYFSEFINPDIKQLVHIFTSGIVITISIVIIVILRRKMK